jgi:hypothetical protein
VCAAPVNLVVGQPRIGVHLMKICAKAMLLAVLQALVVCHTAEAGGRARRAQSPVDASDADPRVPPAEVSVRNLSNLVQGEPDEMLAARTVRVVARDHTRADLEGRQAVSAAVGEQLQRAFPRLVVVDSTAADVVVLVSVSPIAPRRPQAGVRMTALVVGYPPEPNASLRALYSYSGKGRTIARATSAFGAALSAAAHRQRHGR